MKEKMKIMILGYSGSGKSTLAWTLSATSGIPCLHLDQINFAPMWKERSREEKCRRLETFLDTHESWVMDGNYMNLLSERRGEEADLVLLLQFSRLRCLLRVIRRWRMYRGATRPDMTQGCPEKIDGEFLWWVLWKGRSSEKRAKFAAFCRLYPQKVRQFSHPGQLSGWLKSQDCPIKTD